MRDENQEEKQFNKLHIVFHPIAKCVFVLKEFKNLKQSWKFEENQIFKYFFLNHKIFMNTLFNK